MNRYFADISNNNPQAINWSAYHGDGQHVLVGLKATEGTTFIDHTHTDRCQGAHKAGVHVLHYHFGHPGSSASGQAQVFWNKIRGHFATRDLACIDLEVTDGLDMSRVASWLKQFDIHFKDISGHSLIGYAGESFLGDLAAHGGNIAGRRWWVAAYGGRGRAPRGYTRWAHQFTDGSIGPQPHACVGIGRCDVSQLNWATYIRLRATKP